MEDKDEEKTTEEKLGNAEESVKSRIRKIPGPISENPFYGVDWGAAASCDKEGPWLSVSTLSSCSAMYQRQHGTFVSLFHPDAEDTALDSELQRLLTVRTTVKKNEFLVTVASPPERWDSNTSSLSAMDQEQYVFHLVKFRNENAEVNEKDARVYSLFLDVQSKLKAEQEHFQSVARKTAEKFKLMYESLYPDVKRFVAEAWGERLKRVKDYPAFYTKQALIPLSIEDEANEIKAICHGILLEFGRLASPVFPIMGGDIDDRRLSRLYADIVRYNSLDNREYVEKTCHSVYKTSVSKDVNALNIGMTHEPDIVVSISALKAIGDNCAPHWERQWMIPVRVLKHRVKREEKMVEVTVVYLDKPLPKLAMTAIQKNKWFYKVSAKRKFFPFLAKGRQNDFVIPVPTGAVGTSSKDHKRYTAWELRGPKGVLKMALRSSLDGKGMDKGVLREYVASAKPEYQPWAGAEVPTASELNREWISAHFRPGVVTYRARPDVYTGELTLYEKLEEHRILAQGRRLGVFPPAETPQPLVAIYSVLSSLKGLTEGHYLLQHEAKMGPFVKLSVSTPEKTPDAIDIHQIYQSVNTNETRILSATPWLPVDTETITFAQRTLGRVPATFEPEKGKWKNSRFMNMASKFDERYIKKKKQKKKQKKK